MGNRTGRKQIADSSTRQRALTIAKGNPGMTAQAIAERLSNVTPRQVSYWLKRDKEAGGKKP